jgi:hypothetical protein
VWTFKYILHGKGKNTGGLSGGWRSIAIDMVRRRGRGAAGAAACLHLA